MSIKRPRAKDDATKHLERLSGGPLTFAQLIESTRLSDGLTMVQFAKKLGISVSHLNDIEKARKAVSPARAARFAKALGFSEKQYVRLALQDLVNNSGLKFVVELQGGP